MFPTESSTVQLKPETVCQLVSDAEEQQWRQIEFTDHDESNIENDDLGKTVLRHGTGVKKINSYFSNLESRKYCLLLAGRKSTVGNFHLVNPNRSQEGDSVKIRGGEHELTNHLEPKELQTFKHAYLCATYPVLGAPDPPSPYTPSPVASTSDTDTRKFSYNTSLSPSRPTTPYSLQDSGVEDQDEMAIIPTETLCELLQRSFNLTTAKYHQYEKIIMLSINKKTAQKLLAEELIGQLTSLENNSNPFYNPHSFLTRNGYDIWQQQERNQVSEHLDKFWHFSLQFPSGHQESANMKKQSLHNDYCILLNKLLTYDTASKWEESDVEKPLYGLLSSASLRLLKEFGLRYGIGEQYRRIVYLKYLTEKFTFNIWFLHHIVCVLIGIYDMLPSNRGKLVIVREEYLMLENCVQCIIVQASKALTQMKTLFPNNQPRDGIGLLLELISLAHDVKAYLTSERKPDLKHFLYSRIQEIFKPAYEKHKMMAKTDLDQKREQKVCPKLLNILINDIRDEITDYKTNYQHTFERYFDITELAAQAFYLLLMKDIENFLEFEKKNKPMDISLLMLGLAYRLNQLDQDFSQYIPPKTQIWRTIFQGEVIQWAVAFKIHLQDLVLESIAGDKFTSKQLQVERPLSQISDVTNSRRSCSTSMMSITPSANSAFSSVPSSIRSSPCVKQNFARSNVIQELVVEPHLKIVSHQKFNTKYKYDTQSLNNSYADDNSDDNDEDKCLMFGTIRQSSSLPDIIRSAKKLSFQKQLVKDNTYLSPEQLEKTNTNDRPEQLEKLDSSDKHYLDKSSADSRNMDANSPTGQEFNLAASYQIPTSGCDSYVDSDEENIDYDDFMKSYDNTTEDGGNSPVSDTEDFSFPAISQVNRKVTRSRTNSKTGNPALSSGLFSRIYSAFFHPQFSDTSTLNTASVDDIGSAQTNTPDPKQQSDFLDSIASDFSNVTLPDLPNSEVILPISGSTIDMLVLLQRNVYFVQMLCDIVYAPIQRDSQHVHELSTDTLFKLEFQQFKAKYDVYLRFLKSLRETMCLYADNMLCLDLCGTPLSLSKKLIGPKLVEHIQTREISGLVWGCRHQLSQTNVACMEYVNKQTAYLCDRYEPITEQMCIRINNVHTIFTLMEYYEQRLLSAMKVGKEELFSDENQQLNRSGRDSQISVASSYSVIDSMSGCEEEQMFYKKISPGKKTKLNSYQSHVMSVLRAMVRLMAYRLNLFIKDALPLLLKLRLGGVSVITSLKPVTDFLSNYLSSLSEWLYKDCFTLVQEHLWIFIVENFEVEADKLKKEDTGSQKKAENLVQAITYLMKFMNNGENGIRKKLLLVQAEDVLLKLQLYTLSTIHLIALYITLTQKTDQPDYIKIEPTMSALLYKISSDLESKSKCFSGHVLVNWLIHHKSLIQKIDPVYNDGPFYREKAVDFCQKLLNLQILIDVDVDIEDRSITPSICSLEGIHYPGVTIFSQNQHSSSDFLTEEDENGDSDTPIPSPAKSPVSPAGSNTPIGCTDTNFYVDVQINPVQSLSKSPEIVCDKNVNDSTVHKHSTKAGKTESTDSTDNSTTKEDLNISFSSVEKSGEKCQPIVDAYHHEITNSYDKIQNPKVIPSTESSSRYTIKLPLLHSRKESECSSQRTSFTSTSSTGRVVQFCDKKNQFYRVAEAYVYGNHHFSMMDPNVFGDSFKGKIDLSETLTLAERCFLRKISPVTLLSILYSRRKQDTLAKSVIKQLPEHIVDEIKNNLDIPSNSCISS